MRMSRNRPAHKNTRRGDGGGGRKEVSEMDTLRSIYNRLVLLTDSLYYGPNGRDEVASCQLEKLIFYKKGSRKSSAWSGKPREKIQSPALPTHGTDAHFRLTFPKPAIGLPLAYLFGRLKGHFLCGPACVGYGRHLAGNEDSNGIVRLLRTRRVYQPANP